MAKPEGHKDPRYLGELIQQQRITTLHFVPADAAGLPGRHGLARLRQLRRVIWQRRSPARAS